MGEGGLSSAEDDATIEKLLDDMGQLGSRDYSQVGVPMFLIAEDLRTAQPATIDTSTQWREIAAQFARQAKLLSTHMPDLGPTDVARLVELLANRNLFDSTKPIFSALSDKSAHDSHDAGNTP